MEIKFNNLYYKEVFKFYYSVFKENSFPFLENLTIYCGINYDKKALYDLNIKKFYKKAFRDANLLKLINL